MRKQLCSIFLAGLLLLALLPAAALGESGTEDTNIYLAFTSDVHNTGTDPDKNSAGVLGQWIRGASHALGDVRFASLGFCGDYGDYAAASAKTYWQQAQTVMDVVDGAGELVQHAFYIRGNHETKPGKYASQDMTSNTAAARIAPTGTVYEAERYVFYSFGAQNDAMTSEGFLEADIAALEVYLSTSAPTDKPIFILSHFPLHTFNSTEQARTTFNRDRVIGVLNAAAYTHRLFFLWGHNHSQKDPHYDRVYVPPTTFDSLPLRFPYLAAGSMCNSATYRNGGEVQARGLTAVIDAAGQVTFRYYDGNFEAFGETAFAPVQTGFLAGYEGGRMLGVLPVYGVTAEELREDMTLLPCPWSAADAEKVFFLTEDLRPSAALRLK